MISAQLLRELRSAEHKDLLSHTIGGDGHIYIKFIRKHINSKKVIAVQRYIETNYNYRTELSMNGEYDAELVVFPWKYQLPFSTTF